MAARRTKRDTELSTRPGIRKQLLDVFDDVLEGFQDQIGRTDQIADNWDLYNCKLSDRQFYSGNSQIFLPFIHDAVNARKTRFTNQIFPQNGRYVEVTSGEEDIPSATMSLLEGYVRKARLQTVVMPALMKNGDCEGQYSLYVSWRKERWNTVRRVKTADVEVQGVEFPEMGEHDEYVEEIEGLGRPDVEVLHDSDVLVLPVTVDHIDDALPAGGSVTIQRRWTKGRIRKAIDDGDITEDAGKLLLESMKKAARDQLQANSLNIADAAGVKDKGRYALVYETWTELKVDGDYRTCRAFYGGEDNILGCKQNPYWCDRVPVMSVPVDKIASVFKGKPPVEPVADLQILANDNINEGADTSHFSAMPIVMTDPEKNPKTSTMVLGLAAVWETSPQDTQFAEFPELWKDAMGRALACQQQIFQTLGVNPSMIPQSTGGDSKRNQAEIANEQQVDILTVADAVTVVEEGVLTPLIQWFAELDHQFRDEDVTIKVYGELGVRARMEKVEPIQLNRRWEFRWFGVEQARNAAQMQQQIAGLNVIKGIPPQMYPDYELDVAPLVVQMSENLFGPRLGPLIFRKKQLVTMDPAIENQLLSNGFPVAVHDGDDDELHLMEHSAMLEQMGGVDPHGTYREHIAAHQAQMLAKQAMQQMQNGNPGAPGSPGGMGMPGAAGTPPGAQPGQSRMKGPPGMIHPDQMPAAGAVEMPRSM